MGEDEFIVVRKADLIRMLEELEALKRLFGESRSARSTERKPSVQAAQFSQ